MGYSTGAVNTMADLHTVLRNACTAEGWAWDGGESVLSKGAMFLNLTYSASELILRGRTSLVGGESNPVRIAYTAGQPITFPLTYEIFVFDTEVFMVINYAVSFYQFCAFGLSNQALPGTGMWVGASAGRVNSTANIKIGHSSGDGYSQRNVAPALFWSDGFYSVDTSSHSWNTGDNYHLHSDIDGHGWSLGEGATGSQQRIGVATIGTLMKLLPSAWSDGAVLLPIRCWKVRSSYKASLTAELQNARYIRVDNYEPGEIITLGPDQWKVFPWFQKNLSARNGGTNINHTGTFGWAIRYEGP